MKCMGMRLKYCADYKEYMQLAAENILASRFISTILSLKMKQSRKDIYIYFCHVYCIPSSHFRTSLEILARLLHARLT